MLEIKKQKWISFSIYYDEQNSLLINALPLILSNRKEIIKYMFSRSNERGSNLILMFEVKNSIDIDVFTKEIKTVIVGFIKQNPSPDRAVELPVNDWFLPFSANHIEIKKDFVFDIMETGGLSSSLLAKNLLSHSSKHAFQFIQEANGEWGQDSAMGIALQFHLALVSAFKLTRDESGFFYDYFFASMLSKTHAADTDFQQNLLNGLSENYEGQKESMVGFGEYVLTLLHDVQNIEEEWLKEWFLSCGAIAEEMESLQKNGGYVVPENFEINNNIDVDVLIQKKWPVLEYYLRSINTQLGVNDVYELNLIYSLKETFKELVLAKTSN